MTQIDDLLAERIDEQAIFKTLGEVGKFIRGNGLQKSDLTDQGVHAIHYGQIHTYYQTSTTDTKSFVTPELAAKLRRAAYGDLVIATTSEDDAAVAKATAWIGDGEVAVSGDAYIYRHTLDPLYVAYFFQSQAFRDQKKRYISGTKVRRISGDSLSKIRIPVPSLDAQKDIVKVLDSFTDLEANLAAELQTELELRRRQHSYYRNSLLSFQDTPIERPALGDIADFKYGLTASAVENGDFRFIRITDITQSGKLSATGAKYVESSAAARDCIVQPGDLLMARTGATFGKTMLIDSDDPAVYASFLIRIRFKEPVMLPKFYWHFAQSDHYWSQANAMVSTGGQPQFNGNALKLVKVPVPSLSEQERIVAILDELDAVMSDMSVSLPAEIRARRQQYEHYRDRLLTFKELAA